MKTNEQSLWCWCMLYLLLLGGQNLCAQESASLAMIPSFHDRRQMAGAEGPIQLSHQRFVVFVYPNAVAVYSDADFVNTSSESFTQEFALPSTGHDENGSSPGGRISSGILNVQLRVQGKRIAPDFVKDGMEDWYTIRTQFGPGEQQKVHALFWAQTSLADLDSLPGLDTVEISAGRRGFVFDLAHAGVWNGVISNIHIDVVLMKSLDIQQGSLSTDPSAYEAQDSTLTWNFNNMEPSPGDNVVVWYSTVERPGREYNTMAKLSTYIVNTVYDNLLRYVEEKDR